MRQNWIRITLAVGLILLPMAFWWYTTSLPEKITFGIGPQFGLYTRVMTNLAERIERNLEDNHGIDVELRLIETQGSVENLRLLQEGIADFALYQSGTERFLDGFEGIFNQLDTNADGKLFFEEFEEHRNDVTAREAFDLLNHDGDNALSRTEFSNVPAQVRFVANTHSDVAHLVVGPEIQNVHQLIESDTKVSVGRRLSGDYAISDFLMRNLKRSYEQPKVIPDDHLNYGDVAEALEDGRIDGAFIMAGVGAEIFGQLFGADSELKLLPVPFAAARATDKVPVYAHTILAGQHRSGRKPIPPNDLTSIALRAQLLTRRDVPARLVEIVTEIVLSHDFTQQNNLHELLDGGREFARKNPEFPIHAGAEKVYDPDLHPLLPTEFVESTEGIRSFVVSCIIAGFFLVRWLRERKRKNSEHRLDRYIRAILDIERRQIPLDQDAGHDDLEQLQELLDEVTHLRQDALGELSVHELNEDRGAAVFVDMCHELSSKINAKLTRQTFERQLARLADAARDDGDESEPTKNHQEER